MEEKPAVWFPEDATCGRGTQLTVSKQFESELKGLEIDPSRAIWKEFLKEFELCI